MSKHGSTEKTALYLQQHLPVTTDLLHFNPSSPRLDLQPYDIVILGGSVYMGQIQSEIKVICRIHEQELLEKQLGLYICCMNEEQAETAIKHAFPETLRQHAKAIGIMGGELHFEKMSFMEKLVIRTVTGQKESVSNIRYNAIDAFAQAMCAGLEEMAKS